MMNRRDVLQIGVSAAAGLTAASREASAGDSPDANQAAESPADEPHRDEADRLRIIDTNVSLFRWPFRQLPLDEPDALVRKLRELGIAQAWAGSFEAILHRDITAVNERLAETCDTHPELVPIGSVNPELPGWQEDLRRCIEEHDMPGIRLHPNYHACSLEDRRFVELLQQATSAGRFVQIAAAMEDTRTQHPLVRVADVDLEPLINVLPAVPEARVQIINARPRPSFVDEAASISGLFFDTARVDSTDGVPDLVRSLPDGRVLFGTHAPFLIPEAALIRVRESGQLDESGLRAVLSRNADRFRSTTQQGLRR